ncbi:MAG: hypothetical protein CVU57_19385 [Deltaproteobacteria bacterium HGW-Deltaproteobacteria-15]|nr:MAG: hypothetical protein CVU57_19385 [Deltaproteobacteria bacterium HGW-Deltaproteobacteria-15]
MWKESSLRVGLVAIFSSTRESRAGTRFYRLLRRAQNERSPPHFPSYKLRINIDNLAKSRDSGAGRNPDILQGLENTGSRLEFIPHLMRGRDDEKRLFSTSYETINIGPSVNQTNQINQIN